MGVVSIHNSRELIVRTIQNNATVAGFVSDRVYAFHPETPDQHDAGFPCVVLQARGGGSNYTRTIRDVVFEVTCYSQNGNGEASQVYDAVAAAIQAILLTSTEHGVKLVCRETSGPMDDYDQRTRAWFVHGRWVAKAVG